MKDDVNKLRNPDFAEGAQVPRGWKYVSSCPEAQWERAEPPGMPGVKVLTLTTGEVRGGGPLCPGGELQAGRILPGGGDGRL